MTHLMMPTDCAPIYSSDEKNPGWGNCMENCNTNKCKTCDPDPETECGSQIIASGMDGCVPHGCFNKCCKNTMSSSLRNISKNMLNQKRTVDVFLVILVVISALIVVKLIMHRR